MKGTLEGKLALVTGAGSGIGRATALALADKGARVVACDLDPVRVDGIATELGGKCALAKRVDVSQKDEVRALAGEVHASLGPLDVLVNNAGVGHSGGMLDSTLEDWEWVISVNLWGVIYGCHFFVPKMVERRAGGHVVNVASGFGLIAAPGVAPYCTTKFAVVGLSESLRAELQPHGIGVSAICPGVIDTDIVKSGRFADEKMRSGAVDAFHKRGRPPVQVATAILKAIRNDVGVMPVGAEAWVGWIGKRVSPSLTAAVAKRVEKRARNGAGI
jgi:NAD(P)-dependent dehydrogenase (short-subunit alcohol dehydrogenase family)